MAKLVWILKILECIPWVLDTQLSKKRTVSLSWPLDWDYVNKSSTVMKQNCRNWEFGKTTALYSYWTGGLLFSLSCYKTTMTCGEILQWWYSHMPMEKQLYAMFPLNQEPRWTNQYYLSAAMVNLPEKGGQKWKPEKKVDE